MGRYADEYRRQLAQQARQTTLGADASPDDMARALSHSERQGVAPGVAANDLAYYDELSRLDEVESAAKSNPALGRFLGEPDNAALAKDDVPALKRLAEAVARTNPSLGHLLDVSRAARRGVDRSRFGDQARTGVVGATAAMIQSGADLLDTTQAGARLLYGDVDPLGTRAASETAAGVGREVRAEQQAILPERPTADLIRRDPMAGLEQGVAYYAGMSGQSAPLFALALATRNPALGGGILGGTSGAMEYSGLRDEGASKLAAARGGVASGLIESQFERIGLQALLGKSLLSAPFVEAGTEALTELGQGQVSDLTLGRQTPVGAQLAGAFDAAVVGGGMGGAVTATRAAARMLTPQERSGLGTLENAAQGAEDARRLGDIVEAAKAAKLGQRAPGKLEALVGDMADETVYVPASALRTLYQGDAAQFVAQLTGEPEALALAGEYGDVAIPMAKWVAAISPMDNAEEWVRNSRTDPEGLTAAEIEATDWDAELGTAEAAERAEPTEGPNARDRIQQDVFGMLHASGRYRDTDAELQAKLVAMRYATLGDRLGVDPWEVYSRHKLRIGSGEAAQPGLFQKMLDGAKRLFQPGAPNVAQSSLSGTAGALFQSPATGPKKGVEFTHAEENVQSRVAQWAAPFVQDGGASPRAVGERPESIGAVNRSATGAAWQGDESPDALREQSARLIERAKAEGFFWGDDSPILAELGKLTALGGAEHQVYLVGEGDSRVVIRATDNGYFGPRSDISPAQYLARLEDYSRTFPGLQTRLIGVSESDEIEGHAVIWTAQPFVQGEKFAYQGQLAEAMAAHGWKQDGPHSFRFTHEATGTVIEDAHTDNVFQDDQGNLYPFDVVVESLPRTLRQADGNNAPRGQMSIGPGGISIDLLANADRSTFLHELGHLFLEDLAEFAGENAEIGADFDTLLQWGGIAGETAEARLATWQGMDLDAQRELHEAFAENFEQYLLEGKAPSPELRGMFGRFRAWLRSLYGEMRKARIPLTDEVRAVMDRMLASDEEIEAAQVRQGFVPLFDRSQASELGLTDKQFEAYAASLEAATEEARQEVFGKLYKAHQREAEAWWKEEVATHRDEVIAEFEALPAVKAWRVLSGRGPEGSPALKLDRDAVYALLPERAAWIKARILPLGVYSREGGVHPDEAAAVLGYRSGAELLDALGAIPPNNRARAERFDAEAKDRMRGKHPDPMMDGSLPEAAQDAVHKNKRVQALENELGLLAKLAGAPAPIARVLNEVARRAVAKKTIRKLRPNEALAAERKAAREAMKAAAKGDYAAALQAKREQVLQAAMYRAARDAQDRADKAIRYLRRMSQDKARAKLGRAGADYLDQVDALLDRFDFRPMTGKAADRRASFAEWVKAQEDRGVSLDLDPALLDEANRKPHIEMTVGELDGLRDAVKQLDHLATLKGKLLLAGEIRDAAEIDDAMATSVREHNTDRPETTGDRTNSDKLREALIQGRALQGTATDLARELDGFTDGGPVWTHVMMPVREAMNRLRPALRGAQEALSAIYLKHYTKAEIRAFSDRRSLPEVNGDEWSKRRILSLAMNWGNEGNREAILSQARNRLSPEQVSALLGRLDARDWAFVQDVWELIDQQWPAIAEAQKRRTGLVPEKVEPTPFAVRTSDGQTLQLKGGYFPLKYEPDSVKSMRDEAEDFWNAIRMGRSAKASTRRGHTIERVGSGGRTVSLELGLVQTHLRDVLRDIHLGDAVNYAHNTLNGHGFAEALGDTGMLEHRRALEVWLKDVASGEIAPRMRHEQAARAIRQNFTASVLAWKAVSAAIQVTGIVQSSVVLGQQATWAGVVRYLRRPKAMTRYVTEASEMMRERANTHVEAVQQVMDAEAGLVKAGHAAMLRWGYFMMGQIQRTVDVSTWIAAEAKGLELFGGDVDKARAYADDVVVRAQATQEFADKTPLQRGTLSDSVRQSEYIRATTALASYMLAKGNIAYERTSKTNFRSPAQALRWSRDMMILFAFEAMIVTAIRGQWPEDEDEDGWLDDVSLMAMEETFFGAVGGIPGISSISGSLRGYGSGGIVASFADAGRNLYDQAQQGELDKAAIKAWLTVTGFATGIPSGQINKTIDAIAAERDGEDVNAVQYLTGPPYKN